MSVFGPYISGNNRGWLSVHLGQARVEVAHVEGALGRDAAQPRHRDAVDQSDAALEVIHLSHIVEYRLITSRTGVSRRDRDDRRVPVGVDAEGGNLRVIRVRRQHQQRARQIETVREQPQRRSCRRRCARPAVRNADARAVANRTAQKAEVEPARSSLAGTKVLAVGCARRRDFDEWRGSLEVDVDADAKQCGVPSTVGVAGQVIAIVSLVLERHAEEGPPPSRNVKVPASGACECSVAAPTRRAEARGRS